MKRLFALLLISTLLLSACGYDPYDPAMYGFYEGTGILAEGYEIPMTGVYNGENYLQLGEEGKGTMSLAGNVYDIQWGMKGSTFYMELQDVESEGTLEDGVIRLNYLDMDMELIFEYDGDYVPGSGDLDQGDLTEEQLRWDGSWYGWWVVDEGSGSFEGVTGSWWDMCASVTMSSNDRGQMVLWDQDCSQQEPLGEVSFYLNEQGQAVSLEGYFGVVPLGEGDWIIDPNSHGMENMMVISGGGQMEQGSFRYTAYLRPWGQDWSDAQQKPYHYDSWYLPLIEAGQPMPYKLPQEEN